MNKFIGAVVLLFLTLAAVLINSAYSERLCNEMSELVILAAKSQSEEQYSDTTEHITKLSDIVEQNKFYLGATCSESVLSDLNADIHETQTLLKAQKYEDIPNMLEAVSLRIQELYKYEFVSAETLF